MISMPGESFVFPSLPGVRGPKKSALLSIYQRLSIRNNFHIKYNMRLFGDGFQYSKECKYDQFLYYTPPTVRTILIKPKRRKVTKKNFKSFVKVLFQK